MKKDNRRHKEYGKSMISRPMFSIVITTYNRAGLLKRALDSLVSQTENDWEAIVVDDGSTDDTHAQLLPYLKSYSNIKYIWKQHSGAVPSKNRGIKAAAGKFVAFLDSDDEYHPSHLESRKRFLIANPAVRFLYGGVKIIGNPYVPDKDNPSARINLHNCVIGGSFIIDRKVLLSLNGFRDMILGSDADMFERIKNIRIKMAEIKQKTYIYHHENPESTTNILYKKQRQRND